jgi:cell division protein FtsW
MAAVVVVPIGLVLAQPNFGTAMTMGLSALVLLVVAGVPWRWLFGGAGALVGGVALLTLKYPYPAERVLRWIGSWGNFDALSFQIKQGMIALGSGGATGVGLGQSIQKRMFVPDPHTDLILAIIGEEVGFLGLLILATLFGVLLWRGFQIANRAPDTLGYLLAAGITAQIGLYALINAGVVVGLLPVTGLPLPFVSYGGSALMANLASIGILLSISRRASWQGELRQLHVLGTGWR